MSSSVHFKFKSQKEPSRVTFDGTGISVFELKREIISQSKLGDGTDFELSVLNEDTGEEYDDDTTIIPRSTSVIARRLPAARPGKGGAARYVSGKMPVNARNASRIEPSLSTRTAPGAGSTVSNGMVELNNAQTEEEKINALFSLQANQWKEQQQEMANATPVPFGRGRGKPVNVPDHPPPPGYLCYRCREKGHWIQACPTNNDPNFDGKYRVKRSTGIPRSLQTKVEKPELGASDGSAEDLRHTGVMVNADGDFVIAKPDKAAWELYQEKAKASAAAAAEAAAAELSQELQARGLECPIDKRMFLEPTKTPCCKTTYCNDCIMNALIESDFVCPNCGTEGVLLDNLSVDEEAIAKIKEYEAEKADRKDNEKQVSGPDSEAEHKSADVTRENEDRSPEAAPSSLAPAVDAQSQRPASSQSKKRSAEDDAVQPDGHATEEAPAMKKQKSDQGPKSPTSRSDSRGKTPTTTTTATATATATGVASPQFNQAMPMGNMGSMMQNPGMGMPFSDPTFMNGGMPFMNPMMMPTGGGFSNNMDPMWNQMNQMNAMNPMNMNMNMNMMAQQGAMYGPNGPTGGGFNVNGYGTPNMYGAGAGAGGGMPNASMQIMYPMGQMGGPMQVQMPHNVGYQQGPRMNNFSNQQRTTFSTPYAREEDSPYFRQPVNPQRHQAKHRRIRPSDYREL